MRKVLRFQEQARIRVEGAGVRDRSLDGLKIGSIRGRRPETNSDRGKSARSSSTSRRALSLGARHRRGQHWLQASGSIPTSVWFFKQPRAFPPAVATRVGDVRGRTRDSPCRAGGLHVYDTRPPPSPHLSLSGRGRKACSAGPPAARTHATAARGMAAGPMAFASVRIRLYRGVASSDRTRSPVAYDRIRAGASRGGNRSPTRAPRSWLASWKPPGR
jgi:hypothetical protein